MHIFVRSGGDHRWHKLLTKFFPWSFQLIECVRIAIYSSVVTYQDIGFTGCDQNSRMSSQPSQNNNNYRLRLSIWQTNGRRLVFCIFIQYEVLYLISKLISKLINLRISVLFYLSLVFFIYHFLRVVCLARASSGLLFSVLTYSKAMLIHTQNLTYNYVEFPTFPGQNS